MATNNFIVTSLPAYVQESRDLLLKNFALVGTATRRRGITLQTGVKKDAYINYLEVDPTLQDGTGCGFSALGDVELSQRTVNTAAIKVNLDICARTLIGKYAEYLVRQNANDENLPFEQEVMDGLVAEINKKIEKLIWQGDKVGKSSDTDLKWIDGWLKIATDDSAVIDATIASGSSALQGLMAVYAAIPEEVLLRDNAMIFVAPAIYRAFLSEVVAANLYHYAGPNAAAPQEFWLPGTNVRVVNTPGLAGSLSVLATHPRNLVYATDMEGDAEDIKLWFSDDDDVFKLKVLWNSGVQFAFPEQVVLAKFPAAPSVIVPSGSASGSADLSTLETKVGQIATEVTALNSGDKVFKTQEQGA